MATSYTAQRTGRGAAPIFFSTGTLNSCSRSDAIRISTPANRKNLLLPGGEPQFPVIAQHIMPAVMHNPVKIPGRIGQAVGAEDHKGKSEDTECTCDPHQARPALCDGAAPGKMILQGLEQTVQESQSI